MALSFWAFGLQQFQSILRQFHFANQKFSAAAKCIIPLCKICEFGKARRRSKGALLITKTKTHDGISKVELFVLVLKFLLITLNHGFLVEHLILMVGLLQTSLLVDVFLLIMPLVCCMLSIKFGFLLSRLL